jgi:hypothetical protein
MMIAWERRIRWGNRLGGAVGQRVIEIYKHIRIKFNGKLALNRARWGTLDLRQVFDYTTRWRNGGERRRWGKSKG